MMIEYNVTFTQHYNYIVEAEDEIEAQDKAYMEFASDMRSPIDDIVYDEVEVMEVE